MNTPQDPLGARLSAWRMAPRRNPAFRQRVWEKIAAARRPASWPVFVRTHATAVTAALVVAIGLGAMIGREQARSRLAAESRALADAYVQSLDARNMRMP